MNCLKKIQVRWLLLLLCSFLPSVLCTESSFSSLAKVDSTPTLGSERVRKPFEFSFPQRNNESEVVSSQKQQPQELFLSEKKIYTESESTNDSPISTSSSSTFSSSPSDSSSHQNLKNEKLFLDSEKNDIKSPRDSKLRDVDSNSEDEKSTVNRSADIKVFVRKCCKKNQAFILSLNSCAPYNADFTVTTYHTGRNAYFNVSLDQMHVQEGLLTSCDPSILSQDEFILFDTGEILSTFLNEYFHPDHYCLENIVDDSQESLHVVNFTAAYCPNSNVPLTFDPNKVPARKCCLQNELVSSENAECRPRSEVTSEEWTVKAEYLGLISSHSTNFTSLYEIVAGYPECVNNERGESLDSSWNFEISEATGYLHIPSLGLHTARYCIDDHHILDNKTSPFAYVCLSDGDHRKFTQVNPSCQPGHDFCVEKCCPAGQLLNQEGSCVEDEDYLAMPQSIPIYFPNGTRSHVQNIDFNFGSPLCGSRGLFLTKEEERSEIMANGSLRFISYDPNECNPHVVEYIPLKDYCYDLVRFEGLQSLRGPVPGALICYPKDSDAEERQATQVNYIYSIFLVISDIFILISFVIYLTVPDQTKRGLNKNVKLGHSILGRILLSFLFSLFFAYLCLIITKTASDTINLSSNVACITLGVIMYISFLATFFWLNILCFELWWKCARQESTSGRRWLWYQVYAWGSPLLLGSIVLYIEFSPGIGPCFVKPNFGIHSCFFSETRTFGSAAKWIYMNGPVGVLLLADLLFFLLTVKSLMQTVQQSHKGTVKRQARQRLKLCFKLFLVMGICWLTEIISAAINSKWYITEVFNCLQGFVIFLIFILKPKILHAVQERICSVCCGRQTPMQPLRGNGQDSSLLEFSLRSRSDRLSLPKNNGIFK